MPDEKNRGLTGGLKTWPESGLVAQSEMLAVADLRQQPPPVSPPNFPVAAVDESTLSNAPETRMNRGGGFSTI